MTRWVILAVAVAALASAGTVAVQYMPMAASTTSRVAFPVGSNAPKVNAETAPKAVVEGDLTYEFGTLPQETTGKHSWVVKNEGKGPLNLWMISATCSCTLATFKDGKGATVKPGESTEITLEYETRENNGDYRKGAEIGTSDPDMPQFSLYVHGKVYPAIMTMPAGNVANFLNISNDVEDNTTRVALFSKDRPDLKILKTTSSMPDTVSVTFEPLKEADAKSLKVSGGYELTFHVKPGLPLGAFRHEVVLTTDHPKQGEVRMTVTGKMSGPVNLIPEHLEMHQVDGKAGGTKDMIVSVRNNRETRFTVAASPKGLTAEIAPTEKKGRYRLTVTVPPGTPPAEIEGEIVLRTDHPRAAEVIVPVSVWVQNPQ